jgi:hypothetical protein
MGYSNDFTGEITITPPLTWAEIQTSPPLRDTTLRLVEAITDTETGRTITTQAISVSVESGFSGFNAVKEIQALVDHHGATHTFAGHIDAQFEIGLVKAGQPGCERYVVRDGRVETLTPRLVWPGEDDPADRFGITWDHDFAYLWCDDCPDGERPVGAFPGNPTGIAEIQAAMRKHRADTHKEN